MDVTGLDLFTFVRGLLYDKTLCRQSLTRVVQGSRPAPNTQDSITSGQTSRAAVFASIYPEYTWDGERSVFLEGDT